MGQTVKDLSSMQRRSLGIQSLFVSWRCQKVLHVLGLNLILGPKGKADVGFFMNFLTSWIPFIKDY
jgi:hypothetical protein